ncbi:MAG: hypothetical protein IPH54_20675 [Rhodoferax sp.]|nr:hypothetical protein [Rhodoferax sp.]
MGPSANTLALASLLAVVCSQPCSSNINRATAGAGTPAGIQTVIAPEAASGAVKFHRNDQEGGKAADAYQHRRLVALRAYAAGIVSGVGWRRSG